MRVWVDTADLADIHRWVDHPWVSGFTTNPTLMRQAGATDAAHWAEKAVRAANGLPISIDGPVEVWRLGRNVYRKRTGYYNSDWTGQYKVNTTAVCSIEQVRQLKEVAPSDVISVFAGRILDTGRNPQPVIDAAKKTGAQVLWASVREPYHMVMAEQAGCDIITVPPAILTKWLDWHGKPLEQVAAETIAQFEKDREGLWT